MAKITILVGLPGSGKSTWVKENSTKNALIVCKDDIRNMMNGGSYEFNPEREHVVQHTVKEFIHSAMGSDFDIIIDETNLTRAKRACLIEWIKGFALDIKYYKECHYDIECIFFMPSKDLEFHVINRMKDARGISENEWRRIIYTMNDHLEVPNINEGFSEVKVIF